MEREWEWNGKGNYAFGQEGFVLYNNSIEFAREHLASQKKVGRERQGKACLVPETHGYG